MRHLLAGGFHPNQKKKNPGKHYFYDLDLSLNPKGDIYLIKQLRMLTAIPPAFNPRPITFGLYSKLLNHSMLQFALFVKYSDLLVSN